MIWISICFTFTSTITSCLSNAERWTVVFLIVHHGRYSPVHALMHSRSAFFSFLCGEIWLRWYPVHLLVCLSVMSRFNVSCEVALLLDRWLILLTLANIVTTDHHLHKSTSQSKHKKMLEVTDSWFLKNGGDVTYCRLLILSEYFAGDSQTGTQTGFSQAELFLNIALQGCTRVHHLQVPSRLLIFATCHHIISNYLLI